MLQINTKVLAPNILCDIIHSSAQQYRRAKREIAMNADQLAVIESQIRREFRALVDANASSKEIDAKAKELGDAQNSLHEAQVFEFQNK